MVVLFAWIVVEDCRRFDEAIRNASANVNPWQMHFALEEGCEHGPWWACVLDCQVQNHLRSAEVPISYPC